MATAISIIAHQTEFPKLTGPYLGQTLPGLAPEIFARGILSRFSMLHGKLVFSPDGLEAFWTCNAAPAQCLSQTLKMDNIWFPSLSVDGTYLFFCGGYPTDKGYTYSRKYLVSAKIIEDMRLRAGTSFPQSREAQD